MDWTAVKLAIEGMALSDAQKANALELLNVGGVLRPLREISVNAYDGAVSLHWNGHEVAAYEDHYETYRLSDGDTRISHWPHLPGEPFDPALTAELLQAAI